MCVRLYCEFGFTLTGHPPLCTIGSRVKMIRVGRHLAFAPSDQVPMTNLLVSLLDKAGVTVEKLGDSTGRLEI